MFLSTILSPYAQNLVLNPSFESGLTEWQISATTYTDQVTTDSLSPHGGAVSLRLSYPALGDQEARLSEKKSPPRKKGYTVFQMIPVEAESSYEFNAWYRAKDLRKAENTASRDGTSFAVFLQWMQDEKRPTEVADRRVPPMLLTSCADASEWTAIVNRLGNRKPLVAPPGTLFAKIYFRLETNAADIEPMVWIDDVSLEVVPPKP